MMSIKKLNSSRRGASSDLEPEHEAAQRNIHHCDETLLSKKEGIKMFISLKTAKSMM